MKSTAAGKNRTPIVPKPLSERMLRLPEGLRGARILPPRDVLLDLMLILAAGTFTLLVHFQGWRSRELLNLDMLPYYYGAREFLSDGKLLERGEISSYNSYNPPGTWYLMIPGMLSTGDPRLQTFAGTELLLYATLIFLYLAARELSGRAVALAAALVFALSRLGFIGLWPVGHPVFIVAPLYFLIRWVKRRESWALGAALAVLAFGLYVDLAILPFLFVLPALWLAFRPPLGWKSLLLSAAFGLLVWFPYLRFEAGRGFVDLASLLLLRPAETVWEPTAADPIYCYAAMPGENDEPNDIYLPYAGGPGVEERVVYPLGGWKNQAAYRICRTLLNIDRNFDTDLFSLGANRTLNAAMWWIFFAGWAALGWGVLGRWRPAERIAAIGREQGWIPLALGAGGALFLYLLLNPDWIALLSADGSLERNMALAVEQLRGFAPWIWLGAFVGWFLAGRALKRTPDHAILLIAFSLPWLVLVLLAEPGRPERFWFIWPLQVWIAALGIRWAAERFRRADLLHAILTAALAAALLPLPFCAERWNALRAEGYSGADNDQWRVAEYLAGRAGEGKDAELWVEYWMSDSSAPAAPDCRECRIMGWFDYLLSAVFRVENGAASGAAPPAAGHWLVADHGLGVPDFLQDEEPEAVIGHYWIYWIF
ncbi:MAG: hypothetical protein JW929_06305 [Anaerolineales bacterium]|nr:hypothetical protein [Anaerolineales bacterium]